MNSKVGKALRSLKDKRSSGVFPTNSKYAADPLLLRHRKKVAEIRMQNRDVSCYENFELSQMDIVVAEDKFFESVRPRKKNIDAKLAGIEDTEFVTFEMKRRKSNLT